MIVHANRKDKLMKHTQTYGVALLEKPLDAGLTKNESTKLFDRLHGIEAIPIEIQAEHSTAMGWINLTDAEILNYEYTGLTEFIQTILEDMENENPDGVYVYDDGTNEIDIFLTR